MKNRYLAFSLFMVILIYIASCTPAQQAPQATPKTGIGANQPAGQPVAAQPSGISDEVKQLLDKSKTKVSNVYYKYKGPETGDNYYDFYVKASKIKYLPYREIKVLDKPESYNSVYIDKTAKTSQSYCDDRTCLYKGKKGDLNYDDAYIPTMLDWIGSLTSAEKIGEEVIDDRSTWKVQTDKGILWIDTFYVIPLKIDSHGKLYRFQQLGVGNVQDSDVTPIS